MKIYIELLLLALVVIYAVDISGFTQSWRDALTRLLKLKGKLRPLPPFDCGKCATFWSCLIYLLATGAFNIYTLAFSALLSLLSVPLGGLMIFTREGLNKLINKIDL